MPHRGTSNEYPQHTFSWKNKKKNKLSDSPLILSYAYVPCKDADHDSPLILSYAYVPCKDADHDSPLILSYAYVPCKDADQPAYLASLNYSSLALGHGIKAALREQKSDQTAWMSKLILVLAGCTF